ncbi:heavy-metal-associated domain-containing protein [Flavobacterium sp. CYK-55]|uniref:heavy-metal-associated domain-containing protein n=1 Tax=Flavobacterium sp. CYK-55 TaxID=2835529 RepID=UPI001BCEFA54|nr:heavy metal-associated domain-containing protein [Flavobacterium sp. CYK-55]MBS7785957.1 heavy-metal-associated domain-containing protein [Flavobacterium sp. CYK-55]
MNLSKIFAVASCCGFIATGCKQTASPAPDHAVAKAKHAINPEKLQTATFTIEGMTCAIGCAKTIQDELTDLDGVQKATVDFDKKLATVSFDSSLQTPESLTKLVEATADGKTYKVSNMVAGK